MPLMDFVLQEVMTVPGLITGGAVNVHDLLRG